MIAGNSRKNILGRIPFAVRMLALLIALVVGGIAVSTISHISEMRNSQEWVESSQLVLHEIDGMEDSLQDAREAALHYVLTPEKEDLINFDSAVAHTWIRFDRISMLTKDNEGYAERLEQLRGWMGDELSELRDRMRTTKTLLIFHSPDADAKHDRMRAAMQKLKEDQEKILRVRNEAAHARTRDVERSVSLLIGGFSVLVPALILLLILESKKLRIAGQNASGAQTRLERPLQQLQPERVAAAAAGDEKK